jgi:Cupin
MLSGTYELEGEVSRRPLNTLPSLLVLARGTRGVTARGTARRGIVTDELGQEAVLDRLLDCC